MKKAFKERIGTDGMGEKDTAFLTFLFDDFKDADWNVERWKGNYFLKRALEYLNHLMGEMIKRQSYRR